jgi:hypothetical protein
MLLLISLVLAGFFLAKKVLELSRARKTTPSEVAVDTIEDLRGLGYSGQRKIASDKKGNIFIAYRKDYEKHSEIFVARVSRGVGVWNVTGTSHPAMVIGKDNDQRVPSIAIDSKDTVHLVWYGSDIENQNDNRQVKYIRSIDSGETWSSWRNIVHVSGYKNGEEFWQEHPVVAVGKDDSLYVVWEGKDEQNGKQQIKFSKSLNSGDSWSYWKNIQPAKNNTQSRPTITEGQDGKLYVFAYSSEGNDNGNQRVQYCWSLDKGESWSVWEVLSDSSLDARHISVAPDESGNIHTVFREGGENLPTSLRYVKIDSSGKQVQSVSVAPSSKYQFFPSIGILSNGDPVVAWNEVDNSSGFPRENPQGGKTMISIFQGGIPGLAVAVSDSIEGLYPSLPASLSDFRMVPVVFEEPDGRGNFMVKMKFLSV